MAEIPPALVVLLRETSRSFYLTLRILPAPIRAQIGLAYLLARATDTVADTDVIPVSLRLEALAAMRRRIVDPSAPALDLGAFASSTARTASPGEQRLLLRIEDAIAVLRGFSSEDQARVARVLTVITSGQELDLRRFGQASPGSLVALRSDQELDDYTFRVAGCVGQFWTEMCSAHLFGSGSWDEQQQIRRGVEFGKGLQLVNILRDLPRDLQQGRCYLPEEELRTVGLAPAQLLQSENASRLHPVYDKYLSRSQSYLDSGWAYTQGIPASSRRLRMGCALPILIGVRTLAILRQANPLSPGGPLKVSRPWVRRASVRAFLACWGLQDWGRLYAWAPRGAVPSSGVSSS